MKLLTTIFQLESIHELASHVDGFLLGNDAFGTRLTKSYTIDEINQAITCIRNLKKEIFIIANQMMDDDQLENFEEMMKTIHLNHVDGIVVADLGCYRILANLGHQNKVVYNPETLMTNTYDANFLASQQIKGVYLAKEITLADLKSIGQTKQYQVFMVGHGHLNMFYSRRQLIENFMTHNHQANDYHGEQNLKIVEEVRQNEAYPILEDAAGTHVFRANVFFALDYLGELKSFIDYIVIDTIFKDDAYAKHILPLYQQQISEPNVVASIQNNYQETWDEGFLFRKTIYQTKDTK